MLALADRRKSACLMDPSGLFRLSVCWTSRSDDSQVPSERQEKEKGYTLDETPSLAIAE